MNTIVMYGAEWCPDCRRAKSFLQEHNIEFEYRDIDLSDTDVATVEKINNGKRIIPTLEILGTAYTNPDNKVLSELLGINTQGRIVLYSADWCPDCRRAKAFLDSQDINYQSVSIDEFEWAAQEVERINNGKRIIPTMVLNGEPHTNPDNKAITELLSLEKEIKHTVYDTIVIGAGAAGLTTALYLQREKFSTLILEKKNIGGNTFLTQKIENYPGFDTISGPDLMERMAKQARGVGVDIKEGYEVSKIEKDGSHFHVETPLDAFKCKSMVATVGSTYRTLGIPGEADFIGAGVHFCATCDGPFYKNQDVVVVGGGNSAVEESLYLSEICAHVHIVHRGESFSAQPAAVAKLAERENMTTHLNTTSVEFVGDDSGRFSGVRVQDNASGESELIDAQGAFVFIGLVPNTEFLAETIDLDERGFVLCECGTVETSLSGFFAAGDCRKGAIAQVACATGEGVVASFGVKEYLRSKN